MIGSYLHCVQITLVNQIGPDALVMEAASDLKSRQSLAKKPCFSTSKGVGAAFRKEFHGMTSNLQRYLSMMNEEPHASQSIADHRILSNIV